MAVATEQLITREVLEQFAVSEMEKHILSAPFAREFHEGKAIDRDYYIRHLIETVLRMGYNNEIDAYALHVIGNSDLVLSQKMAQYLAEEIGHEALFLADLKRFGVSREEVYSNSPFFSTKLLMGHIYFSLRVDGPLAQAAWAFFVELYSHLYNAQITDKACAEFGVDVVKGANGHINVDMEEDHVGEMFAALEVAMKQPGDEEKAKEFISQYSVLIGQYFTELYNATIGAK